MAASFLYPTLQPEMNNDIEGRRRRHRRPQKGPSFLPDTATVNTKSPTTRDYQQLETNQLLSFLNPAMSAAATSSSALEAEPRTIPSQLRSCDCTAQTRLPSLALEAVTTPTSPDQDTSYTHNKPKSDTDISSAMAEGGVSLIKSPKKIVPPHLRRRTIAPPSPATIGAQSVHEKQPELKVKVGDTVHVAVPTGAQEGCPSQASQAKPKSTSSHKQPNGQTDQHAQDQGRSSHSPPSRGNGRSHGRGRGGLGQARSSRWPAAAETRADPNRWATNWDLGAANEAASSVDTVWADCGAGPAEKRAAASKECYNLADFSGGWAPAPINWDARPSFTNPEKLPQLEKWVNDTEEALQGSSVTVKDTDLCNKEAHEIAPQYWKPQRIERGLSPTQWFAQLAEPKDPLPVDEGDLDDVVPWWDRYLSNESSCFSLQLPVHPPKEDMHPDMNETEWLAYNHDHGGNSHVNRRRQMELAKREAKAGRKKKAEEKAQKLKEQYGDVSAERIRPGLKLYIRPAVKEDMVAVRDIYNYYVRNTCVTPEMEDRTEQDMYRRLLDIRGAKLPFIVAYERGEALRPRKKKGKPVWDDEGFTRLPDKVVGFAYADDWNDPHGMYRFTAEVEVYVGQGFNMKGVGKCLLDKLVGLLDPAYLERGGFDVEGSELDGTGAQRIIETLIINYPYDDTRKLELVGHWLEDWLNFRKMSDLPGIGNKNGKSVSLAQFVRKTGANIDHANPPVLMSR